ANPGYELPLPSTLKGLSEHATLSGLISCTIPPRVDRKKRGFAPCRTTSKRNIKKYFQQGRA
ncbi:MAG: hypothetical protein JXA73_01780, partial [Acidobacteria bacterium]|nr:hypothetical protein [Acidobacteriota bacterium]